ncbi:DUF998 domain-containing protein [Cutibacterium equinum]|uniref:DUF998 domain-containing protein n=1 Tax=Cutibacterium equinum TaxID=3016342 RepID=A0ABY7R0P2_9ACTN|nr:DUF998 domain-containing protein [Cutibacterium equinum]WCC80859.1 DUF998 domain-containing protein [Cutibacterium equinum]
MGRASVLNHAHEATPRRWRAVFLAVASLASLTWAFAGILNPQMSQLHAFISEYSARDQPWRYLFQTTDVIMGAFLCLAGVATLVWAGHRPLTPQGWAGIGFVAGGLFSVVDALVTMDCSPDRSTACKAAEDAGHVSLSHILHVGTSTIVVVGFALPILLLNSTMTRLRPVGLVVAWAWVVFTLLNGIGALDWFDGTPMDYTGLWQRFSLSLGTLWWLTLAADDILTSRAQRRMTIC